MNRISICGAVCVALQIACSGHAQEPTFLQSYREEIKPLFKDRCYACHGALKQEAGLRLDTVESMDNHGLLDGSYLLERLTSPEDEDRMPPEGAALKADDIAVIKDWLEAGAPAPSDEQAEKDPSEHWSFKTITKPPLPDIGETNPVDAFLRHSQAKLGIQTQSPAPRSLLIRRLYLDLIGLPPTSAQLASNKPIAKIADDLLNSPHYGERWGRHWMDIWRYSDWYGLNSQLRNSQKHIWHWREWIIESLNQDKGYDSMVMEMLAGDELAPRDPSTLAATGYLARNYYLFNRTTWLDDTIEHTSKAFLGLTMNCVKCHDHKYDPISNEDYYRLRAIFEPHHVRLDALPGQTNFEADGLPRVYDDKPQAPTYLHVRGNPAQPDKDKLISPGPPSFLATFASEPEPIDLPVEAWAPGVRDFVQHDQLAAVKAKVEQAQKNLEKISQRGASTAEANSESSHGIALQDDFQIAQPKIWHQIGHGWEYKAGKLIQTEATTQRSCLQTRDHHPSDFELKISFRITGGTKWKSVGIRFDADEAGRNAHTVYASAYAGGSKVQLAHLKAGQNTYPSAAKADRDIQLGESYTFSIKVRDQLINVWMGEEFLFAAYLPHRKAGSVELFAFDATAEFESLELRPLPKEANLREAGTKGAAKQETPELATAKLRLATLELEALEARIAADNASLRGIGNGSEEQSARLQLEVEIAAAEVELLQSEDAKHAALKKNIKQARDALVNNQLPDHEPLRGSRRALDQGSHKASQYSPTYPQTSTGRRTALARWIVHRQNPLTARVAVNHMWFRHFGTPLVETVFDFGRRCPPPLHQDLLDYLSVELIESGWSMKHLHRLILNSKAWQQSSSNLEADPTNVKQDPENKTYWRMNPRRMESQVLRDSLLHLSEQLDLTMGGPPSKPSPSNRRRSIYLIHSIDGRDQFVSTFDDADILNCYRRTESIVPQQALAMMNSRDSIEAAKHIANRFDESLEDAVFARRIFKLLLAREPNTQEFEVCLKYLESGPNRSAFVHALLNHNDFQVIR